MRIPPFYRLRSVQQFFAGMAIGGVISWCVFLYINGEWQELFSKRISKQEERIKDLEKEKNIWQNDYRELNKKNEELLIVQEIKVKISQKYQLDPLSVYEVEEAVKEDINPLLKMDIDTAFKSGDWVKKVIENRTHKVNDKRYQLKVKEIVFYTTLSIQLEMQLANN
jgi:hypothetical protein